MAVYAIADFHLATGDRSKSMEAFGGRWKNYEQKIRGGWENTVREEDTVLIAGDLSWAMSLEDARADFDFIRALPGRKIFMKGNHDFFWNTKTKMEKFFAENGYPFEILHNNAIRVEEYILCGTRGWYTDGRNLTAENIDHEKIVARENMRLEMSAACAQRLCAQKNGRLIAFMHFPPVFGDYVCRPLVDTLLRYGIKTCYFGHIHGKYDCAPCVCFEGIEFHIISGDYLHFIPERIG